MKKQNKLRGYVRIIGGKWKKSKIPVFNSQELRPTSNIIRETLFNWLTPTVINNARCLDCFAGTGALSFEALSRYAAFATLIELNTQIATQLLISINKLTIINIQVINVNILDYLIHSGTMYDIIFLDPPFYTNLLQKTAVLLERNGWLNKKSFIYIETETTANLTKLPTNWYLYRKKKTKQILFCLYIRY